MPDYPAAALRARRAALVVSIRALAGRIGYSPEHIGDVERGKHPGSPELLAAMSAGLGAIEEERKTARAEREATPINQ